MSTSTTDPATSGSLPTYQQYQQQQYSFDDQSYDATDSDSYYSSNYGGGNSSSLISSSTWQEPIVVGYAFGPKKMSTMGVVMAEASRVKVIHEEPEEEYDEEVEDEAEKLVEEEKSSNGEICEASCNKLGIVTIRKGDTKVESSRKEHRFEPSSLTSAALEGLECDTKDTKCNSDIAKSSHIESTIITLGNGNNESDLRHIVRYFRSNCSSAAGSLASMSETSLSTATYLSSSNSAGMNGSNSKLRRRRRGRGALCPIQISFVPLDPDQPLEEQHGGSFDLILHKLTEDILSCSLYKESNENDDSDKIKQKERNSSWKRVHALQEYHYRNRNCCLIDDPKNVQTVMSRSDIADVLQNCLNNVKTKSGILVKAPKFVVIPDEKDPEQRARELKTSLFRHDEMTTPLIVKPLIAAGTKQSHFMLIALKESALVKLPPKSIVQEFVNHDATLYKVYVLGDFVSVYERHSLPNLPSDLSKAKIDLVEFDSQRPYPMLKDFGLESDESSTVDPTTALTHVPVTVEEVKPVVNILKQAFGLELFGFDILRRSNDGEWLVVDVNYFPSYKEVPNFPSLLARYLTQRVLDQRRKQSVNSDDVVGKSTSKPIADAKQSNKKIPYHDSVRLQSR